MARKVEYDKEMFLIKAKDYINEFGIELLNSRDLCKYIGCSTQPLFRNFNNMDNFKIELKKYLHDYYDLYIEKIVDKNDYLYTISYAYASFAYNESKIFKALFMSELAGSRTIDEVLSSSWNVETITSIPEQYSLTLEQAKTLYRDVRFYTHGLSCQIACKSIVVTDEEMKSLIRTLIDNLEMVIK